MTRPLHVVEVDGPGPTVVFLHGLFGQGTNFRTAAKELSDAFRSLLVDLPNHGRSPWTGTTDYAAAADAVAATLHEHADGPVHVVGHSMGGKVAMVLALRHPDLVDRLVVVDISPVDRPGATDDDDGDGEFAHLLDALRRIDLTTVERRADADRQLAADVDDSRVRAFLLQNLQRDGDGWAWQADLALLRRELDMIGGFPDVDETFDGRVLWLAGADSPYVREEHVPAMKALFPRVLQVTVRDAGHWVHSEQPQAFTSALRTFLSAA